VIEEMGEKSSFVRGIDNGKWSFEFRFGSIIEIVNVSGNDFAIGDEKPLMLEILRCAILGRRSYMISS
jgi:hypothetical protein